MKNQISLYNRDGAILTLVKKRIIDTNTSEWVLEVDKDHKWVLEYIRVIGNYPDNIEAVDPSGGPFLSIGSEVYGNKYKIIKIIDCTTFWLSERNNN
jgi:hypothetical protein